MKVCEAGFASPGQGLGVHVRQHEQLARHGVDRDRGNQPCSIESWQKFSARLAAGGFVLRRRSGVIRDGKNLSR